MSFSWSAFLAEAEALLDKYLPAAVEAADIGAAATGNPELVPIIQAAGGVAEAAVQATKDAQAGDLAHAVGQVAQAVVTVKQLAAPAAPLPTPNEGGGSGPPPVHQ